MSPRALLLPVLAVCLLSAGASPTVAGAQPSEHPFELVPGSFHFTTTGAQAGEHADWVTSFDFAHEASSGRTYNDLRNIVVNRVRRQLDRGPDLHAVTAPEPFRQRQGSDRMPDRQPGRGDLARDHAIRKEGTHKIRPSGL
jgi:hypothetical protein